jgi:hypothetical protein
MEITVANVQEILREIESLDEEDRLVLERQLAQRAQAEWEQVAGEALQQARQRGIDQAAIDRAVERRRYGR